MLNTENGDSSITDGLFFLFCISWQVGEEGAGHFVKMVHNGIEYGDMQLICEAYHLMRDVVGMGHEEMSQVICSFLVSSLPPMLVGCTW